MLATMKKQQQQNACSKWHVAIGYYKTNWVNCWLFQNNKKELKSERLVERKKDKTA